MKHVLYILKHMMLYIAHVFSIGQRAIMLHFAYIASSNNKHNDYPLERAPDILLFVL